MRLPSSLSGCFFSWSVKGGEKKDRQTTISPARGMIGLCLASFAEIRLLVAGFRV